MTHLVNSCFSSLLALTLVMDGASILGVSLVRLFGYWYFDGTSDVGMIVSEI